MKRTLSPAIVALLAVLIALTTVLTLLGRMPIPTGGYVNLSDVAIVFASLLFGPWVGLIAGGLGAALADLLGGYAAFAPLSLLAHGLEGLVIGWLARGRRALPPMISASIIGAVVMALIYLAGEGLVYYDGWPLALAELPLNLLQGAVGVAVGVALVVAVRRAYPPVERIGQRQTWTEG